jgi:hypothetical protein
MSSAAGKFNRNRGRLTRRTNLVMLPDRTRRHATGKPLMKRPSHSAFSASCSSLVISSVVASTVRFTTLAALVSALSSPFRWSARLSR